MITTSTHAPAQDVPNAFAPEVFLLMSPVYQRGVQLDDEGRVLPVERRPILGIVLCDVGVPCTQVC